MFFYLLSLSLCADFFLYDWFKTDWNGTIVNLNQDGTINTTGDLITFKITFDKTALPSELIGELRTYNTENGIHAKICNIKLELNSANINVIVHVAPPDTDDFEEYTVLNGRSDDDNEYVATGKLDNVLSYSLVFLSLGEGELTTYNKETKEVTLYRLQREEILPPATWPKYIPFLAPVLLAIFRIYEFLTRKPPQEDKRATRVKNKRNKGKN